LTKPLKLIAALCAISLAVIGLSACGGLPGDAVVSVNGTAITKKTFEHWMSIAASSTATTPGAKPTLPDPPKYTACIAHLKTTEPKPAKGQKAKTPAQLKTACEAQYKELSQEVLGYLIGIQWVFGEAESMGIKVSDSEVHKEFVKIKNESPELSKPAAFEKFLKSSGETVSDLLVRVKQSVVTKKIEAKLSKEKHNPSKAEIQKFYKLHSSEFGTPEKRSVRIILTKKEGQAKAAKKEIESGKSFASVAKAKSIDPTSKAKGGLMPEVVKGEEQKALEEAVFKAKKGVLGGPVKTPFGYYVYKVEGTTPGTQKTLAQSEATIKQQLQQTGQQTSLEKFRKEFQKKWEAKTECRSGYVIKDCKGYKAPKTTPAEAAAATGTVK
jgi:foldase protein PrsA